MSIFRQQSETLAVGCCRNFKIHHAAASEICFRASEIFETLPFLVSLFFPMPTFSDPIMPSTDECGVAAQDDRVLVYQKIDLEFLLRGDRKQVVGGWDARRRIVIFLS